VKRLHEALSTLATMDNYSRQCGHWTGLYAAHSSVQ